MGKFTKIAEDAFDALQLDAGVLLSKFDPANPVAPASEDIIATTTGGINPTCTANYSDFGEDVDNVPNNMMEFKHLDGWDCGMSFSTIKFNSDNTVWALGAADVTSATGYKCIKPRRNVKQSDFKDVWWVGDKANGGAFAIRLINALSTGGLSIQSTKNGKGTNAITLTGHVSLDDQDTMPMEFYDIEPGSDTAIYKVAQNLVNIESSFTDKQIDSGEALSATLTPDTGYTIGDVIVLMDGEDITSTAYDAGEITIAAVSGNVVITAVAS